ncbi:MAG: DUF5329 domain-containing protein [Pseudomonadota bacterium]|nr:DUF5329 domain-containing protein [Pseudomonadota bacterium]
MRSARVLRRCMATGLFLVMSSHAAPAPITQAEIEYLLSTVAESGCEFYRNGTWYDGRAAAAHLRYKYDALMAKDLINNSDDFIERAATKSSLSGLAYAIRCKGYPSVSSHEWFEDLLAKYRQSKKDAAARGPDG